MSPKWNGGNVKNQIKRKRVLDLLIRISIVTFNQLNNFIMRNIVIIKSVHNLKKRKISMLEEFFQLSLIALT